MSDAVTPASGSLIDGIRPYFEKAPLAALALDRALAGTGLLADQRYGDSRGRVEGLA